MEHSESLGVFASESCFVGCLDEVWVASELVFSAPGFYHGVPVHYDRLPFFDGGYGKFSLWSLSVDEEVFLQGVQAHEFCELPLPGVVVVGFPSPVGGLESTIDGYRGQGFNDGFLVEVGGLGMFMAVILSWASPSLTPPRLRSVRFNSLTNLWTGGTHIEPQGSVEENCFVPYLGVSN